MTEAAAPLPQTRASLGRWLLPGAIVLAAVIWIFGDLWPALVEYPASLMPPFKAVVSAVMTWAKANLTWATRAIAAVKHGSYPGPEHTYAA